MIVIKKIGLVGVGPYKKPAVLDIVPGVTALYGKNLLNDGNGNAVGKSLLTSALSDIFYDEPIIGTRNDRPRVGRRFVVFSSGKETVKITSAFAPKEQLQVMSDGEDRSGRTNRLTKELLPEYWPVSREEYATYGYMDASVPHPLVRGTSVDRKSFFTSFFKLDQMDAEKRVFLKEMLEVKKVKSTYAELSRLFAEIKSDMLSKTDRVRIEAELEVLEAKLATGLRRQEKAQEIDRVKAFEAFAGADLKKVAGVDLDLVNELLTRAQRQLDLAESLQEQAHQYQVYQRDMEEFTKKCAGVDLTTPIEKLEAADRQLAKLEARQELLEHVRKPTRPEPIAKPKIARDRAESDLYKAIHGLEHAQKFESGICGECGQEVEKVDTDKLKTQQREAKKVLNQWRLYEDYQRQLAEFDHAKSEYVGAQTELVDIKKRLPTIAARSRLYRIRSKLTKPQRVLPPKETLDVDMCKERVRLLTFAQTHKENIEASRGLTRQQREAKCAVDLSAIQTQVYELKTRLELHNTVKGRASQIRARLAELAASVENEASLALIIEAYNDKAMKRLAIEAIATQIMATVNKYSALVFDDYHFEFVWGSQIQILVHRGKEPPTDVRKLSGAESILFTLIFVVLSLLMFVPKRKRLSLLVLDEPTASFSEGTIALFEKLLPHITQVIPSVLIVTPKTQIRFEGAREVTVVRDNSGAYIKEGHPDAL